MKSAITISVGLMVAFSPCHAADEEGGVGGYRSDLWKMEFYQDSEDDQTPTDTDDTTKDSDSDVIDASMAIAVDRLVANAVEITQSPMMVVDTVPFSDSAEYSQSHDLTHPFPSPADRSPRTLTRATSEDFPLHDEPTARGPSIITVFVALMAGIVITSALFSGNQS